MQSRKVQGRLVILSVMLLGAMLMMIGPASAQATIGSQQSNTAGGFSISVTIPSSSVAGVYRITVTCNGVGVYPIAATIAVSASDNTVSPGQTIIVSGPAGSCGPAVNVVATIRLLTASSPFNVAQVVNTGFVDILVERAGFAPPTGFNPQNPFGTGLGNPFGAGLGNLFGGQVAPLQQPTGDGGPIVINNNNSSSSSSSAAAAAGGSGVVTPPAKQLVRTGVDALPLAAAGAAIVLLGFVLLTAGNRTRPAFGNFAK